MATQSPQPDPRLLALAAAYQAQTEGLRAKIERYVRSTWRSLRIYRNQQRAQFIREVVPVVNGAQRQVSSLTSAFLAHQRQIALGTPFKPAAVDPEKVTGSAARLGTPPDQVYGRPFDLTWRQLHDLPHQPGMIEKAITAGEDRAVELALDDVQLAKNHTAAEVGKADDRVKYVRRILEGPSSCGLCIVASTQRYHPAKLMPIHGGCDCGQEFVYSDTDPGQILDLNTLQDIHDRIEQRFGASNAGARRIPGTGNYKTALQYRDVLVTHEHGELGPVLSVRGAKFTGPSDIA